MKEISYNELYKNEQTTTIKDMYFVRVGKCDPKKCESACCKFFMINGGYGTDDYNQNFLEKNKYGDFFLKKKCINLNEKNNRCKAWGTDKMPEVCKQFPNITDSVYKHVYEKCSFKFIVEPIEKDIKIMEKSIGNK